MDERLSLILLLSYFFVVNVTPKIFICVKKRGEFRLEIHLYEISALIQLF